MWGCTFARDVHDAHVGSAAQSGVVTVHRAGGCAVCTHGVSEVRSVNQPPNVHWQQHTKHKMHIAHNKLKIYIFCLWKEHAEYCALYI